MNDVQQGVLVLIKSALTGKAGTLPEDFSIDAAKSIIMRHQIVGMAYEGAVLCGIDKKHPVMQMMFQKYFQQIVRSEKQMDALSKLFATFEENEIDYLPVKGSNMKLLYPNPAMRTMGDADVLIRMEQYEKIKPVMVQLGYEPGHEIDHEIVWDSPALHLELHKRLIPSENADYYSYMGDGWKHSYQVSGHRYSLNNEIMYVFLLLHLAKHYRGGGIGLRQAIDLWVYEQKVSMDQDRLVKELKRADMLVFYQNLRKVLQCWFEDAQLDEKSEFISEYLFTSGSWGTAKNKLVGQGLRKSRRLGSSRKAKAQILAEAIFPPAKTMQNRYRILVKCPWLLPAFWPVRWVGATLFRRNNIRNYANKIEMTDDAQIDSFEKSLTYVGLKMDVAEKK